MKKAFSFGLVLLSLIMSIVSPVTAETTVFFDDFLENDLPGWDHGSVNIWDWDIEWYESKLDKEGVINMRGCLGPSSRYHTGDGYTWIEKEIEIPQSDIITLNFDRRSLGYSEYSGKWCDERLVLFITDEYGDKHNLYDEIICSEWIEETVNLTRFSDQIITIRFEGHGGGNVKSCPDCTGKCDGEAALISYVKITCEIMEESTSDLINSVSNDIDNLKHHNIDTTIIEDTLSNARDIFNSGKYGDAYALAKSAKEMADDAYEAQQHIEFIQLEIDDIKSIGINVEDSESKLIDARDALNKGNYEYAQDLADKALGLTKQTGIIQVKIRDLKTLTTKYDQHIVAISGTVKDIETVYGGGCKFWLDDDSGVIPVVYQDSSCSIKDGDSITVSGVFQASTGTIVVDDVEKPGQISLFIIIFVIVGLLAVTCLLLIIKFIGKGKKRVPDK